MSQFVGQGELEVAGGQVHAVVLQGDQARVQSGPAPVLQRDVLGADSSPVAWGTAEVRRVQVSVRG